MRKSESPVNVINLCIQGIPSEYKNAKIGKENHKLKIHEVNKINWKDGWMNGSEGWINKSIVDLY